MKQIHTYFKKVYNISDSDWKIFSSQLLKEQFSNKSYILKNGEVENYLSFVESGIARLYIPKEENDLTFGFAFTGAFVCAFDSFLTRLPSEYSIQTLSDTVVWRIGYDHLEYVYANTQIGNLIGRKTVETLFLLKSKRELSLLNHTAEERYLNLFSDRPELLRQIPLKYVASYIGVTPQALSRIRKRIS